MADVMLHIGGYNYQVTCADGEEEALSRLGSIVNEQIESARLMAGGLTEARQLLFAAILLADKLMTAVDSVTADPMTVDHAEAAHAATIEVLTAKIEALAEQIELRNRATA